MSRPTLEPARPRRTHFVGRDAELTLLDHEIGRAMSGKGGILLVRGEGASARPGWSRKPWPGTERLAGPS
jgi:hypothetical protein